MKSENGGGTEVAASSGGRGGSLGGSAWVESGVVVGNGGKMVKSERGRGLFSSPRA